MWRFKSSLAKHSSGIALITATARLSLSGSHLPFHALDAYASGHARHARKRLVVVEH
jgi:hypothetical protein